VKPDAADTLGVDIGGVIVDRVREDGQGRTAGFAGAAEAPEIEGAFDAIARLVRHRFGHRVWLVSRCDEPNEAVLLTWLGRHRFFAATGVARDRVRFCRRRHEKAAICRDLGVTHFVDDRLVVLSHLVGAVPHLYLFASRAADADQFRHVLPHVQPIARWSDLADALLDGR